MKDRRTKISEAAQLIAFVVFFILSVVLNLQCSSEESNPAAASECGSHHVTWDSKAQICRDDANGKPVPNSCCGR
jgi:hypothetical protein